MNLNELAERASAFFWPPEAALDLLDLIHTLPRAAAAGKTCRAIVVR